MIGFAANRLMALEADGAYRNAGPHERHHLLFTIVTAIADRNAGKRCSALIELDILKLRKNSYFPVFLEHRRTAGKALIVVIQEAYVQGISPPLGSTTWSRPWARPGIPKSRGIPGRRRDRQAGQSLPQPSAEGRLAHLWLALTMDVEVRQVGRIVPVAVIIAVAVRTRKGLGARRSGYHRGTPSEALKVSRESPVLRASTHAPETARRQTRCIQPMRTKRSTPPPRKYSALSGNVRRFTS